MDKVLSYVNSKIKAEKKEVQFTVDFNNLHTDEDRVKYVMNILADYNIIPNAVGWPKDLHKSAKLRDEGNILFTSSTISSARLVEAYKLYTKSIAFATIPSKELALAYANRSAVLFQLHKYKECILDIDRALQFDYPDNLKAKLYIRKAECLQILDENCFNGTLEEAEKWINKLSLQDPNHQKLKAKLSNVQNNSNYKDKLKISKEENTCSLPKIINHNAEIPCASDVVEVKYDKIFGRHIVATCDINPGEVIAIEKPYSKLLTPTNRETHCSNCLNVCWSSIPCDYCTIAMYCSENCKQNEWKNYHDIECAIYPLLLELDFTKLDLLGIRMVIQALREYNDWEKLKAEVKEVDECIDLRIKGFSVDGKFYSNKYRSILGLVTNTDKRSVSDLFQRALDTCFILYFLATISNLFGTKLDGNMKTLAKNSYVTFVGGLIMRHQQVVPSNMHSSGEERDLEHAERGCVALPFASLLNHSCNPNITRLSTMEYEVLYTLYPIKKGDQIFDNYGQHYAVCLKTDRQDNLSKQYYFKCNCRVCMENWPLYYDLQSYKILVKKREQKIKIKKTLKKFDQYVDLAAEGDIFDKPYIIKDLLAMVSVLYECVGEPCQEMNKVIETLKRVYDLTGNRFQVPIL